MSPTPKPDLVIPVRPGDFNEELRFTLRSCEANLDYGQVWIVGSKPNWLTNVNYLPGNARPHPKANCWANILLACQHPDVTDQIIITNDDIIVTEPVEVETLFRGPLADHLRLRRVITGASWWRESLTTTQITLQTLGYHHPVSYELHVPFPCDKQAMRETLERFNHITPENPPQWRTLHGNLHQIGGKQAADGKAYRPGPINTPYHSTEDAGFRHFQRQLADMFPNPSRYEQQV